MFPHSGGGGISCSTAWLGENLCGCSTASAEGCPQKRWGKEGPGNLLEDKTIELEPHSVQKRCCKGQNQGAWGEEVPKMKSPLS